MNEQNEKAFEEQKAVLAGALGAFGNSIACREKTWPERTDAEKLDALRQEVTLLIQQTQDQQRTIEKLLHHQHSQTGAIVVPLREHDLSGRPPGYRYLPMSLRDNPN